MASIDELFGNDAILVYPTETPVQNLRHTYDPNRFDANGKKIDFETVEGVLKFLKSDVAAWYTEQTGKPMDTYTLGDMLVPVQKKFWNDSRFENAFKLLGLPLDKKEGIKIPWWNEIAGGELEHNFNSGFIDIKLGPRHSYETQLIRIGLMLPIKSVSVGGLILTSDNYLLVGLRGGKTLPNTYHVPAGALKVTPGLKTGEESIYDIFRTAEFKPESGIYDADVVKATIHSRTMDYSIERGPMYNFLVMTNLSRDELHRKWSANTNKDKKEHKDLVFIRTTPKEVDTFIRENYVGDCENKVERTDSEQQLVHPGALALASFSGMHISELRGLYREGLH